MWQEHEALAMLIDVFLNVVTTSVISGGTMFREINSDGEVVYHRKKVYRITVRFKGSEIRRGG